jgi:hypothetical protein
MATAADTSGGPGTGHGGAGSARVGTTGSAGGGAAVEAGGAPDGDPAWSAQPALPSR